MTIPFANIPTTLRVPFVAAEFDSSRAQQGPALLAYRALLIGQKIAAGTGVANSLVKVTTEDAVRTLGGAGSQLHRMAKSYFANNRSTETYVGILDDAGAGTQATKTVTITGPATAAGTIYLYIAGERIVCAVASGDTATVMGTNLSAAIGAISDLPVTSGAVAGVVTLTARNKGTAGNDIDVRVNYQDGEALPAGVAIVVATGVSGATNPTLTTLIAAMGDTWYQVIAHPYTDATSLSAIEAELARRVVPPVQADGLAITSAVGSQSTLGTLGDSRNSAYSCIVAQPGENPVTPPCEFAAAVAGVVAYYGAEDPARPFQTLPLVGVKAPAEADLFTVAERNLELYDGIATSKVAAGGVVQVERLITTYKTNAAGGTDTAYLDATSILTLLYLRYSFRQRILARYPRHKLAADGTRFGAGQAVITPKVAKGEALAWFREMETLGLVEGFEQFKRDLVVERNAVDVNRLDFLLPPDLMNALMVSAASIQFRL